MDNIKNDNYYVGKIVENLDFIVQHMKDVDKDELNDNEVLLDSMMFRLIQIFLISEKNKISAIEVKSSGYKTHPSIGAFSL